MKSMKRLTTSEIAARLSVAQVTVNVWCLQGKFPNAVKEETPRGPVWTVPESDLADFVQPTVGRPPKASATAEKRAAGRLRASKGGSTGEKKGGKK
jgi:hypothetical protein